jgi:hypothetical protein
LPVLAPSSASRPEPRNSERRSSRTWAPGCNRMWEPECSRKWGQRGSTHRICGAARDNDNGRRRPSERFRSRALRPSTQSIRVSTYFFSKEQRQFARHIRRLPDQRAFVGRRRLVVQRANSQPTNLLVIDRTVPTREILLALIRCARDEPPFAVFTRVLAVPRTFAAARREPSKRGIAMLQEASLAEWLPVAANMETEHEIRFAPSDHHVPRASLCPPVPRALRTGGRTSTAASRWLPSPLARQVSIRTKRGMVRGSGRAVALPLQK